MKLSSVQADIVNALKLNSERDIGAVARELHVTEKTVRYHLDSLLRRGIISRAHFIDLYPLGYRYANVYFSVSGAEPGNLSRLLNQFEVSEHVTWIGELGGDFHYGVAFAVRHFEDVREELYKVPIQLQSTLFERVLSIHLSLTMFPLKVLGWSNSAKDSSIGYGETKTAMELDDLGWQLLRLLSSQPHLSLRDLAQRLGRSPSTLSARINELRRSRVFRGEWLRVNFESLGLSTYKLLVYTRGLSLTNAENLREFCRAHRNVDYLIECLGEWDFEIGLVVETQSQVMETTKALYECLGAGVKLIKVLPLLRVLKFQQVPNSPPRMQRKVG